jgi:DNA-binding MarR family transcriptional regulator
VEQNEAAEEAVGSLRALILAAERYRQTISEFVGLGITETQAISYLTVHGDRGQNELAADLGLSSGALTALVDRLERQGIAERYPHPGDRRRTLVRLTARGEAVVQESRQWLLAAFQDVAAADLGFVAGALRSIADRLSAHSAEIARRCPAAHGPPAAPSPATTDAHVRGQSGQRRQRPAPGQLLHRQQGDAPTS